MSRVKEYRVVSQHNARTVVYADIPSMRPYDPDKDAETLFRFLTVDIHEMTRKKLFLKLVDHMEWVRNEVAEKPVQ